MKLKKTSMALHSCALHRNSMASHSTSPARRQLLTLWIVFQALTVRSELFGGQTRFCSLLKDLEGPCQLKSSLGHNNAVDSFSGQYMYLGETNCTVRLEQCRPHTCYSVRDLTSSWLPNSPASVILGGWFAEVKVLSGAAGLRLTREGFSFKATSKEVVLQYTTRPCEEFWRGHESVEQQFCGLPLEAISTVDADTPTSLPCA